MGTPHEKTTNATAQLSPETLLPCGVPERRSRLVALGFCQKAHADVAWLCPPEIEAFEQAIQAALAGEGPNLQQRLERAATQTYEARTASMLAYVDRVGLLAEAQRNQSTPTFKYPTRQQRFWTELRGGLGGLFVWGAHRLLAAGYPQAAVALLRPIATSQWADRVLLGGLVLPLVRVGAYRQAKEVMEQLWLRYGHVGELKQLLFRRGNRPNERGEQVLLFEELATSDVLPLYVLNYCQVVLAHRCVDVKDEARMLQCVAALEAMASGLQADVGTVVCLRANRRNRTKLLVSCFATLMRLHLALQSFEALSVLGMRCLTFVEQLDLNAIDADTSYRLTRNVLRVLQITVLDAWLLGDAALLHRSKAAIKRVHDHCHRQQFDRQVAQENHRGYAVAVLQRLSTLEQVSTGAKAPTERRMGDLEQEAVESLLVLMLRSERDLTPEQIRQERIRDVLPLFGEHPIVERLRGDLV